MGASSCKFSAYLNNFRPCIFLYFFRCALMSLNFYKRESCSRILRSLMWKYVLSLPLSFFFGSRGYTPLRMHNLLKSWSVSCNLLIAFDLVTYCAASPLVPFFYRLPLTILFILTIFWSVFIIRKL